MADAREVLAAGAEILARVLEPHGFAYAAGDHGEQDGVSWAAGAFARDDRTLELGFRRTLGHVVYRVGDRRLAHDDYMTAVLGPQGSNEFPSFSNAAVDAFRHLAHDIERYATAFLSGPDVQFERIVELAGERPRTPAQTLFRAFGG